MSSRRGLTLIETVLAATLLAMVAAAVFSAISSMVAAQDRQQQRLATAELANRFMLQYLDDKESMPDQTLAVPYADRRYRWSYREEPVQVKLPEVRTTDSAARAPTATQRNSPFIDRFKVVTVKVWLGEESGGAKTPDGLIPEFTLTRVVNTMNLGRNPDSFQNMLSTDAGMRRLMEELMGAGGGGGGAGPVPGQRPGGGGRGQGQGQGQGRPPSGTPRPAGGS